MSYWDASLATGNAEIDRVHQATLARMEEVLEAIADEDVPRTDRLLGELAAEVSHHFQEEEGEAGGRLLTREHREGHRLFVAELDRLRDAFARRGLGPALPLWMKSRIVNWFRFHIATHDIPLARALGRLGPAGAPAPAPAGAPAVPPAAPSGA
jgi:hemerythrin-like metal-binding protein